MHMHMNGCKYILHVKYQFGQKKLYKMIEARGKCIWSEIKIQLSLDEISIASKSICQNH